MDRALKDRIRARDKVCVYCGDEFGPYEVDHIQSRWYGGKDDERNLALACQRCNQLKGAQSVDRFLERMAKVKRGELVIVADLKGSRKRYSFKQPRTR